VGYVLLPTATVTLRLASEPVGPIAFSGTADPEAPAVDDATATIPATRITVPLSATGTFPATGKRVEEAPATGQVRWTNCDPTRAYTIPRGTQVRTPSGIAFATLEAVFLPVAIIDPPRITCQNRTVDVQGAREAQPGNVAAGSITVVPGKYNDVVIKVTNPAATSGGVHEEFPRVDEKDVTTALAALTAQLDEQLTAAAASPPGLAANATAYPETARRSEPVPSVPTAAIVGREAVTFDLALTADGSVVRSGAAEAIAAARIAAVVPEDAGPRGSVRWRSRGSSWARRSASVDVRRGRARHRRRRRPALVGEDTAEARALLATTGSGDRHLAGLGLDDHDDRSPSHGHRRGRAAGGASPAGRSPGTPSARVGAATAARDAPAGIDLGTRRVGLAVAEAGEERPAAGHDGPPPRPPRTRRRGGSRRQTASTR
jgi:hypothetical protein